MAAKKKAQAKKPKGKPITRCEPGTVLPVDTVVLHQLFGRGKVATRGKHTSEWCTPVLFDVHPDHDTPQDKKCKGCAMRVITESLYVYEVAA